MLHFCPNPNLLFYLLSYSQAGGKAVTGRGDERVLDVTPTSLHQREPIYLGKTQDTTFLKHNLKVH